MRPQARIRELSLAVEASKSDTRAAQDALRQAQGEAAALKQALGAAEANLGAARADVTRLRQQLEAAQVRALCVTPKWALNTLQSLRGLLGRAASVSMRRVQEWVAPGKLCPRKALHGALVRA